MTLARAASRTAASSTDFERRGWRYAPRSLSVHSRRRFFADRRQRYLSRLTASPSDRQLSQIDGLVRLEWAAVVAEHQGETGDLAALRKGRESRRLFDRLLADFERSVAAEAEKAKPTLDDHLAAIRANLGEASA